MKSKFFMMFRKNSFFLIMLALSCTFNIFAQSADVTQGCFPLTVQFTNKAGVAKPFWDFGDGVSSEKPNPQNTFTKAGNYTVELRDGSKAGALLGTINISVFAQPILGFKGAPLSGCTPLTIPFTAEVNKNAAIAINSYKWDFGDGKNATGEKPTAVYTKGGNFSVTLAIKTNFASCDVTSVFKDTVKTSPAPLVIFSTNPAVPTACAAPLTVNFSNASDPKNGVTFNWDLGNGTKINGVDAPAQTYTKEGAYNVSLTGTNSTGCRSSYSVVVSVGKPKVSFSFPNDTLCLFATYEPKNNSAFGNYQWDFGKDALVSDPTTANPNVTWNSPGIKKVTLSVTESSGACKNDTTINIFIEDRVSPFKAVSTPICTSPIAVAYETLRPYASYSWLFLTVPNTSSNVAKPTVQWKNSDPSGYSRLGAFEAVAKITTKSFAGCFGEYELKDTFNLVNARIVPNKWQGCAPLTVTFADSSYSKEPISSYTFLWDDGSSPQTFTTKDSHDHTFTKAGEYKVRMVLKNSKGCIDTSHVILIEVGDKIKPEFSADKTSVCPGDTVRFKDLTNNPNIDAWHFSTDGDRSWHCFDEPNLDWKYTNTVGPQSVTLTVGYNGCFESTTKSDLITVKGPIAKLDFNVPCSPKNRDVVFNSLSQGVTDLSWNFGDTTNSTLANLTHSYKKAGDYLVKLTATNSSSGCKPSTDSIIVHVRDLEAKIDITKNPLAIPAGFNLCLGQEYNLNGAKSTGVHSSCNTGYTWYFSDPQDRPITTADTMVKFVPKIKGDYKLMLVVKDINGCIDTLESKHRVFGVYPKVTATPKEICTPNAVQFNGSATTSDTTITDWKWKFGDGKESTVKNIVSNNYTTTPLLPGLFLVNLTLTDAVGCGGSWTDTVKVYEPISNIIAPNAICLGDEIAVSATDFTIKGNKLTYSWNVDGKSFNTQSFKNIFDTEGNKKIELNFTETNTGCKGTTSHNIEVQTKPTVDFEVPASLCAPSIVEFKNNTTSKYQLVPFAWDFGNGKTSNEPEGSTVYDKRGNYKVVLFAETSAGCKAFKEKTIIVNDQAKGDFTMSKNVICLGESITFTLKDTAKVGSFTWEFGDGTTTIGLNPVTHTYNSRNLLSQTNTKAKLKLTAIGGACEVALEKDLTINKVIADFSIVKDTICALREVQFTNKSINATKFTWDYGNGKSDDLGKQTYGYNADKKYTYEVTLSVENTTNGCKDAVTKTLTLLEPSVGDDIQIPSIFAPANSIVENQTFIHFQGTKTSDCSIDAEIDYFQVFDRWGQKVYESEHGIPKLTPWNGKKDNSGDELSSDVYVAVFYYKDKSKKPRTQDVTLIR